MIGSGQQDAPLVDLSKGSLPCVVQVGLAGLRRGDNGGSAHQFCPASRRNPPGPGGGYPARPQSDTGDIAQPSGVDDGRRYSPSRRIRRAGSYKVVDVVVRAVTGGEEWRGNAENGLGEIEHTIDSVEDSANSKR